MRPLKEREQVDHIDTNVSNNNILNLRIVTPSENCRNPLTILHQRQVKLGKKMPDGFSTKISDLFKGKKHSVETKRKIKKALMNNAKISIRVAQYDLNMNFIAEWPSIKEVDRKLKIAHSSVKSCCDKIYKQAGGFIWKYVDNG